MAKTVEGWLYGEDTLIFFQPIPWLLWNKAEGTWDMRQDILEWPRPGNRAGYDTRPFFTEQYGFRDEVGKKCKPPKPGQRFCVELEL